MTATVLIPGLLCTAEVFSPQVAALWPYGSVVLASTLEGESIRQIASAILANAPMRFALCGISMGGYIAFEILRQAPERVVKLALLDTSARPDTPEQSAQRRALVASLDGDDFERLVKGALTSILHPLHQQDASLLSIHTRMALALGPKGMARQQEANIARSDSRPGLTSIRVPTLVLVGDCDLVTPPDLSAEIAAAIPNARLVVVPESGHSSTLEQPDAVSKALVEWIA